MGGLFFIPPVIYLIIRAGFDGDKAEIEKEEIQFKAKYDFREPELSVRFVPNDS